MFRRRAFYNFSFMPKTTATKKNILLVIWSISGAGAELVVANLCRHLDPDRFNVSCCHLQARGERGEELAAQGYDIVGLPGYDPHRPDYLSFLKLRQVVRAKKIDLIHSHNVQPLIDASLCRLTLPRVKMVHTFHFGNYPHLPPRYLFMEKLLCRVPSQLVAVGHRQARQIQHTFHLPAHRVQTIYNGVVPLSGNGDAAAIARYLKPDRVVIGALSTFIKQKGIDDLLAAAARLKQTRDDFLIVLVGDGPLRAELMAQSRAMGLDGTVVFPGWIKDAAGRVLPLCDIFLQTSLWEAMSMVVLEAMCAGLPIVATDVGENKAIVTAADAGFIVPPKDVEAMTGHLGKLIDDKILRQRLGQNAKRAFDAHYGVETMARQYEQLYLKVLG